MEEFTPQQRLLMRLRDERCEGNAAELSRRIGKDASYVNRLFYPPSKPGAKGLGLEIMKACSEAFNLPVGYWEGADRIAWPFARVAIERVLALSEIDRAYIEGRLEQALEQVELLPMTEKETRLYQEATGQKVKRALPARKVR